MNIIDADAHMCEPPNLWVERIDTRFRERAPGNQGQVLQSYIH